jgi:hypothetical protein
VLKNLAVWRKKAITTLSSLQILEEKITTVILQEKLKTEAGMKADIPAKRKRSN